ncbi:MAG: TonB-dependent receptor [Candidatus Neomarinimicrobiota bacterium]|nr:TonB-dependent receptor [Candidatus Neomarinimicrobiota bacterium]|tara:strand:+ start:369 stop:2720 length:2352 start_codon:yes stop_codon:yes gene_type:complete
MKKKLIILISIIFSFASGQNGIISGFVTDSSSGEALIGANVVLIESGKGMATEMNGYYIIQGVAEGTYTLMVSYVGFKTYRAPVSIAAGESKKINVTLSEKMVEMTEVEVTAERLQRRNNIQPSKINLSPRMMKAAPALAEPDLFRTIQALPGVLTTSEFSTGLVIRGGNTDQNLILLDGITVYNPSHLGGVFSNFIVDGVKEAELIKGGYNAEYGGRLSAVLNVISREGNRNKFKGKANLSLLSAQTTLEGPFYKGAWLVSGRRTYFDVLLPKVLPEGTASKIPPYYFYDIQSHIFSDITSQDRVSISFYNGIDDLIFDTFGLTAKWGNNTVSTHYRRVFSERLIGNFLIANSIFFTEFGLGGSSGIQSKNEIDDITVSGNMTWFKSPETTVKFGVQHKTLGFQYLNSFQDSIQFEIKTRPAEFAQYMKFKYAPNSVWIIEPGLRLSHYNVFPDSLFPDLRLGVKYLLTDDRYINMSMGNYHQFICTFQDDYNPTILDQWIAVDPSVAPGKSTQFVLGYEEYIRNTYKVQIEGYYKDIKNLLTFEEKRSTTDAEISDEKLSDILTPADGYAYGLEVFGQKMSGKLSGWLAYTFSISRKVMNSIYVGEVREYYTNWDRTHAFSALGNYQFNEKWEMNWRLALQSGQAYTPILGYYVQHFPGSPDETFRTIPGTRNSGRYSPYSRLDLGLVYHAKIRSTKLDIFLQIINTFNRENVFAKRYTLGNTYNGLDDDDDWVAEEHDTNGNGEPDAGEPNVDEADESKIQENKISLFPIIPTIGFTWEF